MTTANSSDMNTTHEERRHNNGSCCFSFHRAGKKGNCCKGNWSAINIAAMVIGFILFWPLGLVVLYWNITGRDLQDLPVAAKRLWDKLMFGNASFKSGESGNSVFEDFQQTQYDRIREIKDEIRDRARRFKEYRDDKKRRDDEAEFNAFMAKKPDPEADKDSGSNN